MANSYTTRVFPQPDIRSPHAQPAGSNSSFNTSIASSVLHTPASSSLTSTSHLPPTATPPHLSSSPSSSPSLSTPSSSPTLSSSHTKLSSPSDHIYKPALSVSTQSQSAFLAYDNSGFDINTLVDAALSQAKLDPDVVVAAAQLCRLANGRWESSSSLYFGGSNGNGGNGSGGNGGGSNGMTGVNNFNSINSVNNNNNNSNFGGLNSGASGNTFTIERNSKQNSKSPSVMALSNLLLPDESSQSVYDYA